MSRAPLNDSLLATLGISRIEQHDAEVRLVWPPVARATAERWLQGLGDRTAVWDGVLLNVATVHDAQSTQIRLTFVSEDHASLVVEMLRGDAI